MILLTILIITVLLLIAFLVAACSVGGAMVTIIFSDVFVCVGALVFLIYWIIKKKWGK